MTAYDRLSRICGPQVPPELTAAIDELVAEVRAEQAAEIDRLQERNAELEAFAYGCDGEGCVLPHSSWCERARKFAEQHSGCTCGRPWEDTPQPHSGHCWLLSPPKPEVDRLRARVAELESAVASSPAPVNTTDDETVVEYGVRTPTGNVLAPCVGRSTAEARLERCRSSWPTAALMQRTVRYGAWTEVER